ncbi:MAG: SUMF1/EgtB/PvdO family nonheme iron enzyme [Planctomycetota bacterium]
MTGPGDESVLPSHDGSAPNVLPALGREAPGGGQLDASGVAERSSASAPANHLPREVGPYRVTGTLGQGGMGVVLRALEVSSGREVALKVLLKQEPGERALLRFQREGEVMARLTHPGIVRVYAAGRHKNHPWLACELVEGARPLDEACAELGRRDRCRLVLEAARALAHAHEAGVVHRDVKPGNLLVDAAGRVRVTDFGLAAVEGGERLTQTGALVGTPYYMSPEQLRGQRDRVGPPSDVWSLGVVLYELLTNELPFDADSIVALSVAISQDTPVPPRERVPELNPALQEVCLRALHKAPEQRYPDAGAFAAALSAALDLPDAVPLGRGAWAALLALPAVALVLLAVALRGPRSEGGASPPASPVAAPTLTLELDPAPAEVWGPSFELSGRLRAALPDDAPEPRPEGVRTEPLVLRLDPGRDFRQRVTLGPGTTVFEVLTRTRGDESVAPRYLRVVRRATPAWFDRLPAGQRPPVPLPADLEIGAAAGEYLARRDGSVLVWVPAASFEMGARDEIGSDGPQHRVTIRRGFFIGKYELSWGQLIRYAKALGVGFPRPSFPVSVEHPAHNVDYELARRYCAWAGLRLPTEAEWELAARGTDGRDFPWGNEPPDLERACFYPSKELPGAAPDVVPHVTRPVRLGERGASACGAYDMAGNVWEWVEDWFAGYPDRALTDPLGPEPKDPKLGATCRRNDRGEPLRVVRGGSYRDGVLFLRANHRDGFEPDTVRRDAGFRVALCPEELRGLEPRWEVRFFALPPGPRPPDRGAAWAKAARAAPELVSAALAFDFQAKGPSALPQATDALRAAALPGDAFGTRASAQLQLEPGAYELVALFDDGISVRIDDRVVLQDWGAGHPRRVVHRFQSAGGRVRLEVDHFQGSGQACLHLWLRRAR